MKKHRHPPHPIATGPAKTPKQLGDRVRLSNGLELTLVYVEGRAVLFRAAPAGEQPEMWSALADRPGVFVRVGEWPHGPKEAFDVDEAVKRAHTAQLIAETLFDLNQWAPLVLTRAVSPEEAA